MLIVATLCVVTVGTPVCAAELGVASWYSSGSRTANGERFPSKEMTCAHKTARFGTHLKVTDLKTGRSIVCRCNDRGPFVRGRLVDLNPASAHALGMSGLARVRVEER